MHQKVTSFLSMVNIPLSGDISICAQTQEKTPAIWEEKAGVTVLSNNKGEVMPDSHVA